MLNKNVSRAPGDVVLRLTEPIGYADLFSDFLIRRYNEKGKQVIHRNG